MAEIKLTRSTRGFIVATATNRGGVVQFIIHVILVQFTIHITGVYRITEPWLGTKKMALLSVWLC